VKERQYSDVKCPLVALKGILAGVFYNKSCFLSSMVDIRMISEGSCDTEDWGIEQKIQL